MKSEKYNNNKINLMYFTEKEDIYNIFGDKFVKNNKNNIDLIINGVKENLIVKYKLKKGENNILLVIKNKIIHLEYMFYKCSSLRNIDELKYLNTKDINNFSYIFSYCSSLTDLNGLENWDVSNANNFEFMFGGCVSLSNLNGLKKWNVLNANNFECMFYECKSLKDLNGLQHWDVSNAINFQKMFWGCSSLKDLNGLNNWNISNVNNFKSMLMNCNSLIDIRGIQNWEVLNTNDFEGIFGAVLNIEEILMIEEKLSGVISCIQNGITCEEECFDFLDSYYHTTLSNNIEKYFIIKDEYVKIVRRAVNLNIFSLMLCYKISYNYKLFVNYQSKLEEIMNSNHMNFILISKYLLTKVIENNQWVNLLEQLILKYDPIYKDSSKITKEIDYYSSILIKIIPEIIICQNSKEFLAIYNQLEDLSSQNLYNIYKEKIYLTINTNGTVYTSSHYSKNNITDVSIQAPFLPNLPNKLYTLVLGLDETLIHFVRNPNDENCGTIKIRPYLYQSLVQIKKYYELVIFTTAEPEYAGPIINALEYYQKYFDYRLFRSHTIIIDNNFVKDLSKLGRDLSRVIIVDNKEQNYRLHKNNGIKIKSFWGKDNKDSALIDLKDILIKIAEKNLDVRTGLKIYREDIISKVTF